MNQRFFTPIFTGFGLLAFAACIQTEIVPEILQPRLSVSPKSVSLVVGNSTMLTATFTDSLGESRPEAIQWQSANTLVATVSSSGSVSAQSSGQAWVIASAPGGLADSVLITVVENNTVVARVEISGAPATLNTGASTPLQARAFNMNNQELSGQTFTWLSSNPAVLEVNTAGIITGVSAGTATVTANTAGLSSLPAVVEVIPASGLSRSGAFTGNSGYTVKGTATLRQSGNDLSLELGADFMSGNGPMLGVYLAKNASGSLNSQNSLKLGNLKSNSGAQTYPVPAGVGLTDYDYVVIYCIPFNVRFGTADLQ